MKKRYLELAFTIIVFCVCFGCTKSYASPTDNFITLYWYADDDQQVLLDTTKTTDLWDSKVPETVLLPSKAGYEFVEWYDIDSKMNLEMENITWEWLVADKNGNGLKNVGIYGDHSLHFIPIWKKSDLPPNATPTATPSSNPTSTPETTNTPSSTPVSTPINTTKPTMSPQVELIPVPTLPPTENTDEVISSNNDLFPSSSPESATLAPIPTERANPSVSPLPATPQNVSLSKNELVPTGIKTFSKLSLCLVILGILILFTMYLVMARSSKKKSDQKIGTDKTAKKEE